MSRLPPSFTWIGWLPVGSSDDRSGRWIDVSFSEATEIARNDRRYRMLKIEVSTPATSTSEVHAVFPRGGRTTARLDLRIEEAGLIAECEVGLGVGRGMEPKPGMATLALVGLVRTRAEKPDDPRGWWSGGVGTTLRVGRSMDQDEAA